MSKIIVTAVILVVLSIVFQNTEARPGKQKAAEPYNSKKDIADIEDMLDSIQQRLAYVSDDVKNLIDTDLDPLIDEIDDFIVILTRLIKSGALKYPKKTY